MLETNKITREKTRTLLSQIKRGGDKEREAIEMIYRNFDYTAYLHGLAIKTKMDNSEILDILHDSFLIFRRNVKSRKVDDKINIQIYITSIAKNIIQNKIRRIKPIEIEDPNSSMYGVSEAVDSYYHRKDSKKQVDLFLKTISEKCRELLKLWQLEYNYDEICKIMKISTPAKAKKDKFNCMKKLIDKLPEFPELKSLLS